MRTLTICNQDIARYTIVLSPTPAPAETTAAKFLQKVISTACRVTLPISDTAKDCGIYLGSRDASDEVKLDGFRITTDDKNVYLDGNIPRGTLYAAYDFAEKHLGYRMFAPDCEIIPTEGAAEVPANFNHIDNPGMEARRTTCFEHMHSPEYSVHCRLNDCMPNVDERWGGQTHITGDCHTLGYLLHGNDYFEAHPEYYALVDGKRIPCYGGGGPGMPCLTNPDVLRIVTEKVLCDLREHPEKTVVDVSQTDGPRWCTCEKCAAIDAEEGSHAGIMLRFVNAIAEAVEKEFPYARIQTFAYEDTLTPPRITKPRHNVVIRYCTMPACCRHAIDDPNCKVNATEIYPGFEAWRKISSHISIWHYITNWHCFIAPFPNLISLRENIRYFADSNVRYFLGECNADNAAGGAYTQLKEYLVGKLLWNPHMSEEEYGGHIKEFLQAYYGKGWREIAAYIALEYEATKDRCISCLENIDIAFLRYSSDPEVKWLRRFLHDNFEPAAYMPMLPNHPLTGIVDRMTEVQGYFDRALAMAETDTERMHIERSRVAVDYLDLFCSDNDLIDMPDEERKVYLPRVKKFYEDKEKYNFRYNLQTSHERGR